MMFMLHRLAFRHFRITPPQPFWLRLAGGTGGMWLDMIKIPDIALKPVIDSARSSEKLPMMCNSLPGRRCGSVVSNCGQF